jgi:periplasmic copper chaperone A
MKFKRLLIGSCAAMVMGMAGGGEVLAQHGASEAIKIEHAWVRETPIGGSSGGGYLVIANTGSEADKLISAESSVAKSIELKQVVYVGEALRTRDVSDGIEIPPKSSVQLRWESYYLLFVDLKEPFARFQHVEASLNFEKAGQVKVRFEVRPRAFW